MAERPRSGGKNQEEDEPAEGQLSEDELAQETGEPLPDRAALSTLQTDVAIPVNPALAADVLAGPDDEMGEEIDETADSEAPAEEESES